MVRVENLTKVYGDNIALDRASFSVKSGQITGFLGPNGAGKSTAMNIICGYISPSQGRVFINEKDFRDDPEQAKRGIGYLPERPPLYKEMLVHEYLDFVASLKGLPKTERKLERIRLCKALGLEDVQSRLIGNLSQGYRQRVGLAQALCGSPELLVLDEPTIGLDPRQIIEFRNCIINLKPKHTVLISSHILSEIESLCDCLIVINRGKVVAEGTKAELMKKFQAQGDQIHVCVRGLTENVSKVLARIEHIKKFEVRPCSEEGACEFLLYPELTYDVREPIFYALSAASFPLLSMIRTTISLEDVFLRLTQQE